MDFLRIRLDFKVLTQSIEVVTNNLTFGEVSGDCDSFRQIHVARVVHRAVADTKDKPEEFTAHSLSFINRAANWSVTEGKLEFASSVGGRQRLQAETLVEDGFWSCGCHAVELFAARNETCSRLWITESPGDLIEIEFIREKSSGCCSDEFFDDVFFVIGVVLAVAVGLRRVTHSDFEYMLISVLIRFYRTRYRSGGGRGSESDADGESGQFRPKIHNGQIRCCLDFLFPQDFVLLFLRCIYS